jgi:hypothetical protein
VSPRNDEDLVQVAMHEPAVQREVVESRLARRVVLGAATAAAGDGRDDDG